MEWIAYESLTMHGDGTATEVVGLHTDTDFPGKYFASTTEARKWVEDEAQKARGRGGLVDMDADHSSFTAFYEDSDCIS